MTDHADIPVTHVNVILSILERDEIVDVLSFAGFDRLATIIDPHLSGTLHDDLVKLIDANTNRSSSFNARLTLEAVETALLADAGLAFDLDEMVSMNATSRQLLERVAETLSE